MIWIGTSWKMRKSRGEARAYAHQLRELLGSQPIPGVQPFVLPSLTSLDVVVNEFRGWSGCMVGAQNGHWEDEGAWTGEVSMAMLADAGAQLVAVGHAERRRHFGETDTVVRAKVAAALRNKITPILCVGETGDARAEGKSEAYTLEQVRAALDGIGDTSSVVLAYEPVWAIGQAGRRPTADEVAGVLAAIGRRWPGEDRVRAVLYGGSVDQENAAALLSLPDCQGLFASRAARTPQGLLDLITAAREVQTRE